MRKRSSESSRTFSTRTFPRRGNTLTAKSSFEREPGASVFLVGRGSVQVVLEGENGAGTPVATLRQGEFFGEMALIEKKPRAATVKARENSVLLEIKGQEFLKLLDEHKDVESKMLLKLSERLRHANDQVLAFRIRGVDEKVDALKAKHDAELKAVDAQLRAAIAIFDQTKIRTDEIISSAERSRSQRTWFFATVGTIMSLAAAFGLKETLDIKRQADKARTSMQAIYEETAELEKIQKQIRPAIEKFERARESLDSIILSTQQPQFEDALVNGTEDKINNTYSILKELHGNLRFFLNDIERAMEKQPKGNYTNILQVILNDSQDPEDRIRAHYLLLTCAILTGSMENFEKQLQNFKRYVETRGPFNLKQPYDLSLLKSLFLKETPEKQRRFKQVVELVPSG
jgi:CRP-like cAMP-binding protein